MKFMHPEVTATWPKPNYIDPEERGPELFIVNSIFFSLATVAVCVRLYTRLFIRKWFGLDDWLVLFAWLCGAGDMGTIFWAFHNVWWDRHMWDAHPSMLEPGAKAMFPAKIFWACCSTGVRLSLLVLYYRLLNHLDVRNWKYRWAIHVNVFIVFGILMCYIFTTVFACNDIKQYWHWPPAGYCISEGHTDLALSILNTCSEAMVAALPIPMIMRLGMISRQRIGVLILFCLGFLVSVVGSVRCYFVYMIFWTDDMTWYSSPHWICSEVEICVAMICASAPAIGPTFTRMLASESPFARLQKIFRRVQQNCSERKSSRIDSYLDSTVRSCDSFDDISSIREHNDQYCRTVDVEGIGLDGFGYTVTITTARSGTGGKKSTLRKLVFPEEYHGIQNPQASCNVQTPARSLFKASEKQAIGAAWALPDAEDVEKGFQTESHVLPLSTDVSGHGLPFVHGSNGSRFQRTKCGAGDRRESEETRGYTVRRSGRNSYFYETETEEDSS